ncbi:hypothetical protein FRC98_16635 [Lujinxingia vulgaris]|uniref:Alginate export domain-containing protein n=1 Tax=Lujinxingia vulgaris TaxID=2600176 RepID=A0A5C6X0R2_9DELT|nr:hypothetical protein [Lujinxingia vulgaris]TXD35441.1 hypothetical protein FRC98_16635 [Lujinxingia vulgaris]
MVPGRQLRWRWPTTAPLRATHTLLWIATLLATAGVHILTAPADAHATTYQVRTQSRARATQHLRADRRWEASRTWTQALHLSAHDLMGDRSGRLNARLSFRYFSDAALAPALRDDPRALDRFNDLTLDLAYVDWRPFEALQLRAGRHWAGSALGVVDLDGLSAEVELGEGPTRQTLRAWAGRKVDHRLGPFDPATFDVQGVPLNDPYVSRAQATLMGAAVGLRHRRHHRVELAASRTSRKSAAPEGWGSPDARQIEHRFGMSAFIKPARALNLSTLLTFHGPARAFDRALMQGSVAAGKTTTFSLGLDHRLPIFDAASIFNLFGASPRQSAYMTVQRALPAAQTSLEVRAWARAYRDAGDLLSLPDHVSPGAALGAHTRLRLFDRDARLGAQVSYQTHSEGAPTGDQLLVDASLRVAATPRRLWLTARHLTLYTTGASGSAVDPGEEGKLALSTSLGAEVGLGALARLSLLAEHRQGSALPSHALLYANLTLELWP